jgi:hypothetical protein
MRRLLSCSRTPAAGYGRHPLPLGLPRGSDPSLTRERISVATMRISWLRVSRSHVERGEERECVVGESDLLVADGGPELEDLVEGNAEDDLDAGLRSLIE